MDINGSSILVTGGTGSFGKKFTKLLLERYKPRRLVVFSRDELKQFEMNQELDAPNLRYFIGDVRDEARLRRAFQDIDIVVHAAALKQVPAAEYNPIECIMTNVMGAENVINVAIDSGVKKVVALSTDKAVNPVNLYGATKLCADKLFVAANNLAGNDGTRFSNVRYGNVIGSRGSVVPFFKKMRETGALPITDTRMTRFWITLDQGAQFVARCIGMLNGGETFVAKLPSMQITDLAEAIAPGCEQKVVGIRPGEKLHEVMVPSEEARHTIELDDFFVIKGEQVPKRSGVAPDIYEGQLGAPVDENFRYASDSNDVWLSVDQLRKVID